MVTITRLGDIHKCSFKSAKKIIDIESKSNAGKIQKIIHRPIIYLDILKGGII